MSSTRIAAATLALLATAYAVAPGTAAAGGVARTDATGCTATVFGGGPQARLGGVARCEADRFRVVLRCMPTLVSSPSSYTVLGPAVDGPGESWAYCYTGILFGLPTSAQVEHL